MVVTSNLGKSPEGVSGKQFNRPVVAKLLSSSARTRILHQPHTHTQTISDETNSQLQGVPKNEVLNRNQDDLRGPLSNNFKLDWVGKRGAIILDHLLFAAGITTCSDFKLLAGHLDFYKELILGHSVGDLAKQQTNQDNIKPN